MSADSVHLVEQAFSFAVQPTFDAQCGEFIGHHTNAPTGCVSTAAVSAINQDLRRSLGLIAGAERAILRVLGDNAPAQGEQPGDFELYLVWRQREDLPARLLTLED